MARPVSGRQAEPLFGTWQLDLAESQFNSGPPAYRRVTCKIESVKDGMKVVYDMVGLRGGVTHWEWTGRVDGSDYPLRGVEEVVTNAYTRTGDRSYSVVFKVDGRTTTTNNIVISADGRSMTVTAAAVNAKGRSVVNTAIYQRQ